MIYKGRRYIKSVILSVLRQFFANHPVYTWSNSPNSLIHIDEKLTKYPEKYPSVIISDISPSEIWERSLNRGFQVSEYDENNVIKTEEFGGPLNVSLDIRVYDLMPFKAEAIADEVLAFLVFNFYEKLKNVGIEIKNVSAVSPATEFNGKDIVMYFPITIEMYTEWTETVSIDVADTISGIFIPDYEGLITEFNGVTYPNFNSDGI